MQLYENMLIEWQDLSGAQTDNSSSIGPRVERVLNYDLKTKEVIVINLFDVSSPDLILDQKAWPILCSLDQIEAAHKQGVLIIRENDPFDHFVRPEDKIKPSHREDRDNAWAEMAPLLVNEDAALLLNSKERGVRINGLCRNTVRPNMRGKEVHLSKTTVNKRLRLWWQSGRKKNSFLPNFDLCGAPGKQRLSNTPETNEDHPKLGRRSALAIVSGKQQVGIGIRMTPEIYRKFELGIKRFYKTTEQRTLHQVFDLIIKTYFHVDFKIIDGEPVRVFPEAEQLPSFDQFYYWYNTVRDPANEAKKRQGEREYNLKSREIIGDSTQMAFGPGSIYQIDSTIANIYLVSALDRTRIIGRPVLYNCLDVFSRVLAGFCVTLEGPSWIGAMLALDNVTRNKVEFCAEYGIEIDFDYWPCEGLPKGILADRGEFEGYNADNLVNAFGTDLHTTGPYRADWKGIVERSFGLSDARVVKFTPGYVPPRGKVRGDPDYDLKAVYTLDEFRKLLIFYAIDYNMNHYLKKYRKDEFMIADHVPRYPIDIWNWGIRNRSGRLSLFKQEILRLNLLPRTMASVTPLGIQLPRTNLYYSSEYTLSNGYFVRARTKGNWRVEIAHDPRTTKCIYLPLDGGMTLDICEPTPACKNLPAHDWHEAVDYYVLERAALQAGETRRQKSSATIQAQKDGLVSQAVEATRIAHAAAGPQSKSARRKGRNDNRAMEKQVEREKGAWLLGASAQGNALNNPSNSRNTDGSSDNEEYIAPSSNISRIEELLEKDWDSNGNK
jgi:putative transposase